MLLLLRQTLREQSGFANGIDPECSLPVVDRLEILCLILPLTSV